MTFLYTSTCHICCPFYSSTVQKHHHVDVHTWQNLMEKEQKETEELSAKYNNKLEAANVRISIIKYNYSLLITISSVCQQQD